MSKSIGESLFEVLIMLNFTAKIHFFVRTAKFLTKKLSKISKYGFGIYIVHYFVVGPIFILIGKFDLPIPLQVPIMALLIFIISWAFTWFMYRILGERAKWIMG